MAVESSGGAARRYGVPAGAVLGSLAGGALLWGMGYYAIVDPLPGRAGTLLFLGALIGMVFGIVAPLTVVVYFGNQVDPRFRIVYVVVGYVLIVSFVGILAVLGVPQALGVDSPVEVIAFLDGICGLALGAVAGDKLARRLLA